MQPGRTHAQDYSFPETTSAALYASKDLPKMRLGGGAGGSVWLSNLTLYRTPRAANG